jgi:hypothetical protein
MANGAEPEEGDGSAMLPLTVFVVLSISTARLPEVEVPD